MSHLLTAALIFSWNAMQGTTHLNMNSGLFYIQANVRTVDLMKRVAARLAKEKAWDQVCLLWPVTLVKVPLQADMVDVTSHCFSASILSTTRPLQSVFNEEIFFLSHGDYKNPGVTVRVMDIYLFMNSKVTQPLLPCTPV